MGEAAPFDDVGDRRVVNYLLRNTQQELVSLSGQADLKASIVMTTSAIVTSSTATQWDESSLRWSLLTLTIFLLMALLAAVASVFPSFRILRRVSDELPPHFNPLFFAHTAQISKDRYFDELSTILKDDVLIYQTIASDLYDQGVYLLRHKYRYLRLSYAFLLVGFIAAAVQFGVTQLG